MPGLLEAKVKVTIFTFKIKSNVLYTYVNFYLYQTMSVFVEWQICCLSAQQLCEEEGKSISRFSISVGALNILFNVD